jgi:HEPN domain-containing protein
MKKATKKWVRKAEADLLAAKQLASAEHPFHDHICNNCQQSAEKYFKAFLHEIGVAFRRTHDLEELLDLTLPHDKTLARLRRGLAFLTEFAVDYRYPGQNATARKAKAGLRWAERVRTELRKRLKLRP